MSNTGPCDLHFCLTSRCFNLQGRYLVALHLAIILFVAGPAIHAQDSKSQPSDQADDVIRIDTELVQTDVMVFDRAGRFVDGLKPDQFELRVDGKAQTISFFERVIAGRFDEEAQLAAARGTAISGSKDAVVKPMDRGRLIYFLVDDLHHSVTSLVRTRETLLKFIDQEMRQNDQVAIASVTGQIGFLQQLTHNKSVLRAAVARLTMPSQPIRDNQRPSMSESMALAIDTESDPDILSYFTDPLIREGTPPNVAENLVKGRAKQILSQSDFLTKSTLLTLETLAKRMTGMPGRKLLFFVSDGFVLNTSDSDTFDRLRNITNAAAHNGLVIYSLDARGLSVGQISDASVEMAVDSSGRPMRYSASDISVSQEPLRVLAANTGGRALLNSNSSLPAITKAVQETSVYYLLAWRPDAAKPKHNKFRRIEVTVNGRKDLTVFVRSGFYDVETNPIADRKRAPARPASVKTPDGELREAIKATYAAGALPTRLALVYLDVPNKGVILAASIRLASQYIGFEQAGEKRKGVVDLAGVVMNDQGKSMASFRDHLDLSLNSSESSNTPTGDLIYNYQTALPPGLYQVRVAARDDKSGRTGSAMDWVEIPNLASGRLALSSLLFGELPIEQAKSNARQLASSPPRASTDRVFSRSSKLRFMTFIYNAARVKESNTPDVALQVQILRDDQPVLTTALRKVEHTDAADLQRLAYAAEISLATMPSGRYILQITVIDKIAKTSASQRADFEIE